METFVKRTKFPDMEKPKVILANDPSFTAWGIVVINLNGWVVECNCIKTEPQSVKSRIRKGDDRIRRLQEIIGVFLEYERKYNIRLILSELPHGSQNASVAIMIGAVVGLLQGFASSFNIPVEWFSEMDAKKALIGKRSATKEAIIKEIDNIYGVPWTNMKYKDESFADALAIYHCAVQHSEILKSIMRGN